MKEDNGHLVGALYIYLSNIDFLVQNQHDFHYNWQFSHIVALSIFSLL